MCEGWRTIRFNERGVSLAHGMGCTRHDNCFTCIRNDCTFTPARDMPFTGGNPPNAQLIATYSSYVSLAAAR